MKMRRLVSLMTVAGFGLLWTPIQAKADLEEEIRASINKGIAYLSAELEKVDPATAPSNGLGASALGTLALIKCGDLEEDNSPLVKRLVAGLRARCSTGVYRGENSGGADNYEAAAVLLAISAADSEKYQKDVEVVAKYLLSKQRPNGSWGYGLNVGGGNDDTSMTQYGLLGLMEASLDGVKIETEVWDKAMHWLVTRQDKAGSFVYWPTDPGANWPITQGAKLSMCAGGSGSLFICRYNLPHTQKDAKKKKDTELLKRVVPEGGKPPYEPLVTAEMANRAINKATSWMKDNAVVDKKGVTASAGSPFLYYMYAFERYGAFSKMPTFENLFRAGAQEVMAEQSQVDGSFNGEHGDKICNTAWALLFLGRAGVKLDNRIRLSFGQGTMVAGRGNPGNAGPGSFLKQERFQRHLKSSVDDVLKALDDLDSAEFEEKTEAVEEIAPDDLVRLVGHDIGKLRKLTYDKRFVVRKAGYGVVGRTRDMRVVPLLIRGLDDPEDTNGEVYKSCRSGLRFISRRIDAMGLPDEKPKDKAVLAKAMKNWQEWYKQQRVAISAEQEFDEPVISF